MRKIIKGIMASIVFVTVATGQPAHIETRRFSQKFALQHSVSSTEQMFHVFTNHEQMGYFFRPVIISDDNAVPVISSKDFVNQFVVAVSGSKSNQTMPVITTIQPRNKTLYVYYEEVKSGNADKSAVMAVSKGDFREIVFVDRYSGSEKRIYYNDVPPVVAKIVVSYLDMPATDAYKHEYQISIDEMGEVIGVKDENGLITSRVDFAVSPKVFEELRANTSNLDNGGEKLDRSLPKGRNYKEILLLDDTNQVVYSLTWDNHNPVNESTRKFVQTIENLVPEKLISFGRSRDREVAKN